jgi:3-dehydroquinate dehydratase/shikimate dehydrogenase
MLVIPVINDEQVKRDILNHQHLVDGFEIRWDFCHQIDDDKIRSIRQLSSTPMLFTLRTKQQGGFFQDNQQKHWQLIQRLAAFQPEYMDLEWDLPIEWFLQLKQNFPNIKLIASYHDYVAEGKNLEWVYQKVKTYPICQFKFACSLDSSLKALQLYLSSSRYVDMPMTFIAMGETVAFMRILGPILNNAMDYVCSDEAIAAGQLTVNQMLNTYHYRTLNANTRIYALLGDPVDKSLGHIWHNQQIILHDINAIYIKIQLMASELKAFLQLAFQLPFDGFSITMPLKRKVVECTESTPFLVVNTIKRGEKGWLAAETDGQGACRALKLNKPSRVLIIGDGGAALSIQNALLSQGHAVFCDSRKAGGRTDLTSEDIDCIINTIPAKAYDTGDDFTESVLSMISHHHLIMDINYNQDSIFQDKAFDVGATVVDGYLMFQEQAKLQFDYWFK